MDDENIKNEWNNSTSFILVMVGAIIGLAGIWRFSYLIYENGGGSFLIPYILAIVIMAIPLLALEFGVGFKYKASLPRIFYNIKSEFEIVAWFIIFLIFLVLIYYTCIMSWGLIYIVLSLFKGWGNNPSVFFTTTLLHSTSSPYGLTYLVVPIGLALIAIWALIYFISCKEINRGISLITKFSLALTFILVIILSIFALQLPGSRTGLMALFNPNWEYLLDFNIWLTAFGQLIFSYGLAYGISSTYASYLPEDSKLIDSAWIIVLLSFVFEILMSILIFALLGHMALGKNIPITSLVSDGFSLIFVVFPNVFNVLGSWAYLIGPAFFLALFIGGIGALFALIEPLANAISEKFLWTKDRTIKTLVLVGLFASFIFATGMGEYLLRIVDSFINQFAILIVVLLEILVFGWLFDIEDIRNVLNGNSHIKLGKYWVYIIKFIIPIILIAMWILGIYNLILAGDRQSLLIQSILASIIVLVPLVLTVMPFKGDYSLGANVGYNFFKDIDDEDPDSKPKAKSRSRLKSNENDDTIEKTIDDFNEPEAEAAKSLFIWDKFKKSKNGKNVLNNVDLSSSEFDSPSDDDYEEYRTLDDDYNNQDDLDNKMEDYKSRRDGKSSKSNIRQDKSNSEIKQDKSKSLFEKINLFNKDHEDFDDSFDDHDQLDNGHDEENYNPLDDFDPFDSTDSSSIEDIEVISPQRDEKTKSRSKSKSQSQSKSKNSDSKKHQFKSSKDLHEIEGLDNLNLGSSSRPKPKSKSNDDEKASNQDKPKEESEEYDDFSDDFFDDDVFGDEGYESLLDDYVAPKSKSNKKSKKESSKSNEPKPDRPYYDFEKKGADSVFNLDD